MKYGIEKYELKLNYLYFIKKTIDDERYSNKINRAIRFQTKKIEKTLQNCPSGHLPYVDATRVGLRIYSPKVRCRSLDCFYGKTLINVETWQALSWKKKLHETCPNGHDAQIFFDAIDLSFFCYGRNCEYNKITERADWDKR